MARCVISVNLSLGDAEEYEEAITATRREYNVFNKQGKRCSKGKALMYLIRLGRNEYAKMINKQYTEMAERNKKLQSVVEGE